MYNTFRRQFDPKLEGSVPQLHKSNLTYSKPHDVYYLTAAFAPLFAAMDALDGEGIAKDNIPGRKRGTGSHRSTLSHRGTVSQRNTGSHWDA